MVESSPKGSRLSLRSPWSSTILNLVRTFVIAGFGCLALLLMATQGWSQTPEVCLSLHHGKPNEECKGGPARVTLTSLLLGRSPHVQPSPLQACDCDQSRQSITLLGQTLNTATHDSNLLVDDLGEHDSPCNGYTVQRCYKGRTKTYQNSHFARQCISRLAEKAIWVTHAVHRLNEAHKTNIDPRLLTCMVYIESGFRTQLYGSNTCERRHMNPKVYPQPHNDFGLGQVRASTAQDLQRSLGPFGFKSKVLINSGPTDENPWMEAYYRAHFSPLLQLELSLMVLVAKAHDSRRYIRDRDILGRVRNQEKIELRDYRILVKAYRGASDSINNRYFSRVKGCFECLSSPHGLSPDGRFVNQSSRSLDDQKDKYEKIESCLKREA